MKAHNNMKILLKNRGVTGRELSRQTGISHSTISQGINGRLVFNDQELELICTTVGITVEQIYPDNSMREALAE
jgi:transcriptional regulator with XRE-family HTH domain